MNIEKMQHYLRDNNLDGWLLADFHARNNIAIEMLDISGMISRRWFYFIAAEGEPVALVHSIERDKFEHLPGRMIPFSGYMELEKMLADLLGSVKRIAMEYSPKNRLPYIGLVDAGTIEMIKELGLEIIPSSDLVANFKARMTPEQMAAHRIAARNVVEVKEAAHRFIADALKEGRTINEYDVSRFILEQFEKLDMETDHPPNCSIDANAGNPHYEPTAERSAEIKKGSLVLIDLWARLKHADGIYGDITWMAYAGTKEEIPQKYVEMFKVICAGRDAAVEFLRENIEKRPVFGAEVDNVCRKAITEAGLGELFTHRTGHSIHSEVHGPGPNIDNLEAEDSRQLQPGHLFSIEPGVYNNECGLRTEIDVMITHEGIEVTTLPLQTEIVPLL